LPSSEIRAFAAGAGNARRASRQPRAQWQLRVLWSCECTCEAAELDSATRVPPKSWAIGRDTVIPARNGSGSATRAAYAGIDMAIMIIDKTIKVRARDDGGWIAFLHALPWSSSAFDPG